MGWYIGGFMLLLLILYLLWAPFIIEIDSDELLFQIRFHKLVAARLIIAGSSVLLELNIAGWKKQIDLLQQQHKVVVKKYKKVKKNPGKIPYQKFIAVLKSFSIRKFELLLDTGNNPLNGILFPVFSYASFATDKNIAVNFTGKNKLVLQIENNLLRIIGAYMHS